MDDIYDLICANELVSQGANQSSNLLRLAYYPPAGMKFRAKQYSTPVPSTTLILRDEQGNIKTEEGDASKPLTVSTEPETLRWVQFEVTEVPERFRNDAASGYKSDYWEKRYPEIKFYFLGNALVSMPIRIGRLPPDSKDELYVTHAIHLKKLSTGQVVKVHRILWSDGDMGVHPDCP